MSLRLFAFLLAILPVTAASVPVKPESVGFSEERLSQIHETMQRHIDAKNISGAVTLVARKGRIVHFQAHGVMDIEANRAMTKDTIFRIFSMSKPVAGVAIMMLVEQGKVRLNDPVSKYIPECKGMKVAVAEERPAGTPAADPPRYYMIPSSREITIQDLLTHVSGLGSGPASAAETRKLFDGLASSTLSNLIPKYAAAPLDFQPGSRWSYSALAGFDTLGRVVEVASGMTFDQFLKENLFGPLGMKTTAFHPGDDNWPHVASAYHRADGTLQKVQNPNRLQSKTYFSGAGGLVSTAEDYAQFAMMLAGGGQWNGKRLLSPKTVEWMSSAFVQDTMQGRQPGRAYGLSVQVVTDPIRAGYRMSAGSFGWDGAYGTHFWVDPKEKIVGIMMIQTDNPDRQLDRDFENAVMQAVVE
ncbi:MAG: beta-lactamase family protein [Acidobacteria bacterium]|nr:beta-lactamase family protein [Acidobacteriota bacterium]